MNRTPTAYSDAIVFALPLKNRRLGADRRTPPSYVLYGDPRICFNAL